MPVAPLGAPDKRQIGNIACNIARFKTVGSLALASATAAKSALGNITSTDPAVMSAAAAAATKVGTTIAAGEQVVANC
ncbi:hypothetical protein C0991_006100 [Blastosporella zonata]|nr:hypothetical protein C0991_006100 [Blastosporella zonata]